MLPEKWVEFNKIFTLTSKRELNFLLMKFEYATF